MTKHDQKKALQVEIIQLKETYNGTESLGLSPRGTIKDLTEIRDQLQKAVELKATDPDTAYLWYRCATETGITPDAWRKLINDSREEYSQYLQKLETPQ